MGVGSRLGLSLLWPRVEWVLFSDGRKVQLLIDPLTRTWKEDMVKENFSEEGGRIVRAIHPFTEVPFLLQLFSIVFLFEREEEICGDLGASRFEFDSLSLCPVLGCCDLVLQLGALLRLLFGSAVECSIEVLIWFCSSVSANCLKTADKWGLTFGVGVGTILWRIWLCRNEAVFNGHVDRPDIVCQTAIRDAVDFLSAQEEGRRSVGVTKGYKWLDARDGCDHGLASCFKLNFDGGIDHRGGRCGMGAVRRDWNGKFIAARAVGKLYVTDPLVVEAMAAREGLQFARELGLESYHC
ncbi:hypothetical protein RHMOL_Rhmol05G0295000 [Rhododendron molle]|uniref:Uncharacterized protein n=1 Tax=Rhododendron molle TaxID=49168 RepID=A0ACC0NUP3_RHOML|nr:hypothetical protein RHMOL_Rhmol05G0295000 [Rhododendron molle]